MEIYGKWPTPRASNPSSRWPGTGGKVLAEEVKKHRSPSPSSPGGFHARTSRSWVAELASRLVCALVCGVSSRGSLASYDHESSSWRTSQLSLLGEEHESLATLPRWGTTRAGELYPLPTPELGIGEKGGGAWPTPRAEERSQKSSLGNAMSLSLAVKQTTETAKMLPTPKASADKMGRPRTNDRGDLQAAVLLPTLAASSGGDGLRWGPTPMEPMIGSLNPDWCERLMGYPSGWTALGGDPDGRKARPELREALKTALHACDASETP